MPMNVLAASIATVNVMEPSSAGLEHPGSEVKRMG